MGPLNVCFATTRLISERYEALLCSGPPWAHRAHFSQYVICFAWLMIGSNIDDAINVQQTRFMAGLRVLETRGLRMEYLCSISADGNSLANAGVTVQPEAESIQLVSVLGTVPHEQQFDAESLRLMCCLDEAMAHGVRGIALQHFAFLDRYDGASH